MKTDKNYYSIMLKYPEDDGTCFSLQTRFDTCDEAVEYAQSITSNYFNELDLRVGWCVRYYFRAASGEWSSMIVVNTDSVNWNKLKKGGESKQ